MTGKPRGSRQTADDITALKGIAIAAAETVYHYKLIARAVNRDEDTLLDWRKADKDFSDKLEQGRHRFIEKNVKLAKPEFLLERLEPELFKQRTQVEADVNNFEVAVNAEQAEQLIRARAERDNL